MKAASKAGSGLGALAAVACVACCALPVLIAAGVLSGGAAAVLAESMPVIAIALAVPAAAAFGVAAYRRARPGTCATEQGGCGGSSCGCTTGRS